MGVAIAILFLAMFIFGSSAIIELIQKKRREKTGENIIREPWKEIHDIPGYHTARHVAAFYPMKGEPNLMPIVEELVREGRLLLPRSEADGIMHFYKIENLKKDLVKGRFGIMEPRETLEKFEGDIPIFLVPGTLFFWDGSRKGHGMGYYDRFLAKFPNAYKAGIATPKQIAKEPFEIKPTDIKMHTIIPCKEKYV